MDTDEPFDDEPLGRGGSGMVRWRPPGWTSGRAMPIAAGVAIGLLVAQAVAAVFLQLRGLLVIVIVSLFLSFAIEPAVQWLSQRGVRRGAGTGLVFLLLVLLLGAFIWAMTNLVIDQVRTLLDAGPTLLADLADQAEALPGDAGEQLAGWLQEQRAAVPRLATDAAGVVGRGAIGIGQTLLGGLFQIATTALVTFYLVADGPRLRFLLASRLSPAQQVRALGVWELAISKTGGYVYSRLLTAIVSAIFHVTVFTVIGLDYAIALGLWVGIISSLIPAVGTYLAGALPLIVGLAASPAQALWVLIAIVAYQQVENYVVVPRITASTLQLHPAIAFLSVIAGGVLAGATGALLAIPAVAIATALLAASTEEFDVLEHQLVATGPTDVRALVDRVEAERSAARASGQGRGGEARTVDEAEARAGRRSGRERRTGRDRRAPDRRSRIRDAASHGATDDDTASEHGAPDDASRGRADDPERDDGTRG